MNHSEIRTLYLNLRAVSFAIYTCFCLCVGKQAPAPAIVFLFVFILRRFLPSLISLNFDLPATFFDVFEFFDKLDQLKVVGQIFTKKSFEIKSFSK